MKEAIWAFVGMIGALGVAYVYDVSGLRDYAARVTKRRSEARIAELTRNFEQIEAFHSDRTALNGYLLARIVLIQVVWVAQSIVDYLFGLISNGAYSASAFALWPGTNAAEVQSASMTIASIVGVCLLSIVFLVGFRAYGIWRQVADFDAYKAKNEAAITGLQSSIDSREHAPGVRAEFVSDHQGDEG